MDTIRVKVSKLKAVDIFLLHGNRVQVRSIAEYDRNIFGDPLFMVHLKPLDKKAADYLTAYRYNNPVKWQGYLEILKEAD